MPEPENGEGYNEFIERCMGDRVMERDFPDTDQRLAVCERQWETERRSQVVMQRKTITSGSLQLKQEQEGEFSAVFATLNVIDKDGDVITPGAITNGQRVRISAYNHSSWGNALPVGKGVVTEQGEELVVDGQFFLDTQAGAETYKTVKNLEALTEYSFGFDVTDAEPGQMDGQRVRFLKGLNIYEVSPVLLGAGVNTRTVDIKEQKGTTLGNTLRALLQRFVDQGENEADVIGQMAQDSGTDRSTIRQYLIGAINCPSRERLDNFARVLQVDSSILISAARRDGCEYQETAGCTDCSETKTEQSERFADHADRVRDDVGKLVMRCRDIADMRKREGKDIGRNSKAKLWQIRDDLSEAVAEIDKLTDGGAEYEAVKLWAERLKRKIGERHEQVS
jgi:HK97 family phage prohead protease